MARRKILNILVDFKSFSIGKTSASIGFSVSQNELPDEKAREIFCGKRFECCLVQGDGNQRQIPGMEGVVEWSGIAECKSVGLKPEDSTGKLNFALEDVIYDPHALIAIANGAGRLQVFKILKEDEEPLDPLPSQKPLFGTTQKPDEPEPFDGTPIDVLLKFGFTEKMVESVAAAGITSAEELQQQMEEGDDWHVPLAGFGTAKVKKAEDAMNDWLQSL